ncbi:phosphoadenosine phosphosulfate reductase [Clostridiaceae bacterium]|nr:phosphoadenosine phosphosulfate reductase [Clostridiaceae bacterium]
MEQYVFFDELPKKVARAIDLFRTFEAAALKFRPEGYYLAFSGGKDSVTIYWLAKMAGVKFTAHYHLTTVDSPELVRFIRKDYPEVQVEKPELTMWELIVKKQIPPLRRARYCCEVLKEQGGKGAFTVTGVRWQESRKREKRSNLEILTSNDPIYLNCDNEESRRQVETCTRKGKRVLNPIIDWTEEEVWRFIRTYHLPYCILYDMGFRRLGCLGCPLASTKNREKEFARYPQYARAYIRAFDHMVEARTSAGKTKGSWKDGESVFRWWMYGNGKREKQIEGQMEFLFDDHGAGTAA